MIEGRITPLIMAGVTALMVGSILLIKKIYPNVFYFSEDALLILPWMPIIFFFMLGIFFIIGAFYIYFYEKKIDRDIEEQRKRGKKITYY